MTDKELWRRRSANFDVEILVGEAWTKHGRFDLLAAATSAATSIGKDASVREVRVLENRITHVCIIAHHADTASVVQLPPTLMRLGKSVSCPVCGGASTLTDDGSDQWSVCPHCERTMPVA